LAAKCLPWVILGRTEFLTPYGIWIISLALAVLWPWFIWEKVAGLIKVAFWFHFINWLQCLVFKIHYEFEIKSKYNFLCLRYSLPRSNQIRNKLFLFSVDRGRICMYLWSDNTRTLITHGRTRLKKTLFLRTFHDQYRRRQVVDQCSLWKERPQISLFFTIGNIVPNPF